jgi:hypothetical protein
MILTPSPKQQFFGNNGRPLDGGLLFTYAAGTNNKIDTYSNASGTLNTNPIVLDFRGEANIWLDPEQTYKFVLSPRGDTDPPTNPIWSVDNIEAPFGNSNITQQFIGQKLWPRSQAEIAAGVTPVNYAYPPGVVDRYGTNTIPGTTDMGPAIQAALNQLLAGGDPVSFFDNEYLSNSQLTLLRSDSTDATELLIFGNGATITFPGFTGSEVGLTVGATSDSFFLEIGSIVIDNLRLLGPEPGNTTTDTPATSSTGLLLTIAGRVRLENVQATKFYTGYRSTFAFPVTAIHCSFRNNFIGIHLDESSNLQQWIETQTPSCRYCILIKSTTTTFDGGKSNNIRFDKWWPEGSMVGCVIDSGSGGSGASRFRNISFQDPYISGMTYDFFRVGTVFDFATPGTRGANCSEFISDIRITDGLWNPAGGVWSATQAAIAYDSVQRVRHAMIDIPVVSKEADNDVFVNGPAGGVVITRAFPLVADGVVTEYLYDAGAAIVRRFQPNGNIIIGSGKDASGSIAVDGIELKNGGQADFAATDNPVIRLNRRGSTGTIQALFAADALVGSIDVIASSILLMLDVTNNVFIATGTGTPEGSLVAGVGSLFLRRDGGATTTLYVKTSGTGNTGWTAK